MTHDWQRDNFVVSTDPQRLQLDVIHRFLSEESYWSRGIARERVEHAIQHALPFGLYAGEQQIGFTRVITDYTLFAYLADVFVVPQFRSQGLGVWLIQCVTEHPELQGLRRWLLVTQDAQPLYAKFGWEPLVRPERWMERLDPELAARLKQT